LFPMGCFASAAIDFQVAILTVNYNKEAPELSNIRSASPEI
jgi:hypothetical protein